MAVCECCGVSLKINSALVDFGEGAEEFEFEACTDCRIVYITGWKWKVRV